MPYVAAIFSLPLRFPYFFFVTVHFFCIPSLSSVISIFALQSCKRNWCCLLVCWIFVLSSLPAASPHRRCWYRLRVHTIYMPKVAQFMASIYCILPWFAFSFISISYILPHRTFLSSPNISHLKASIACAALFRFHVVQTSK